MVKHAVQVSTPDAANDRIEGWPPSGLAGAVTEIVVRLEIDDTALRLVRAIEYAGAPVTEIEAWRLECDNDSRTADSYEALSSKQEFFSYWSVGVLVFGREWLNRTTIGMIHAFIEERDEERERLAGEAEKERLRQEDARVAETRIAAYFREKKGNFLLELERGSIKAKPIWSIAFEESWERDRFWDWLGWQTDRFEEFADFMRDGCKLELERKLLREMLVTEQAVKKQGLGSGGRRPLRFWRGEL